MEHWRVVVALGITWVLEDVEIGSRVRSAASSARPRIAMGSFRSPPVTCSGLGGFVAWRFGVDAEQKSLEDIAPPISATETPHVTP